MFCAVSLAIVWGTTLERHKFSAYAIFAIVFAALIYPLIAHWGFGGGLFAEIGNGVQDFAGSSVVHLTGATGGARRAAAARPAQGQVRPRRPLAGDPGALDADLRPRRADPVARLVRLQRGSTLGTSAERFAEVAVVTQLAAAAGVIGASPTILLTKKLDVGMAGNGAIAGLVGITAPSGYVEFWAAPIIGLVAGVLVVVCVLAIDKKLDDPVGALSAHGMAGIWGTLACGLFTSPRLAETVGVGEAGLFDGGGVRAARRPGGAVVARRSSTVFVALVRHVLRRSRRPSGCASATRQRKPAWTSPSTACTGIRSSSSPRRSSSASPRPPLGRTPGRAGAHHHRRSPRHEEGRSVHPARGVRADPHGAAGRSGSPRSPSWRSRGPAGRRASPSATAAPS